MKEGDGGPVRGVLGVSRGPPLLIVLLLFSAFNAQADAIVCRDMFTPAPDTTVGNTLVFNRDVAELTDVGTTLLDLVWQADVFDTPILEAGPEGELAIQYLVVAVDGAVAMNVAVLKELKGLPDYPDRKDSLVLVYIFPVTGEDATECKTRIVFTLQDQNTVAPTVDQPTYMATVREDFPAQYTVPNLQVLATDLDGAPPNNVLVVTCDDNCPLTASSPSYNAQGGEPVPITFVLKQKLDYDTMEAPTVVTCSVKVSDTGTDPGALDATLAIQITVEPFNDETPQFEYPLYNCQLEGVEVPPNPLTVLPAPGLLATDADKPIQTLAYSMVISNGEDPQWNGYFLLDAATGDVTQTQAIDPDLLGEDYSIHFIVTAEDDGGAKGTTVLEIVLPTAPTTSTTSTTTLTTTPSTTTSTTTSTTSTTAPTTTTTTTEPPSTTTCTPCDTTTQTTWTTPLETTTSTTTESTTIPTTTTTSTTTIPVTTEPVTCEPCTTEIVTCPTIESTTSTTEGGSQNSTLEITSPSFSPTDSPVSSTESSTSPLSSTQSTDYLGTSPTPNPASPQTGGTSTPEVATCPSTGTCEPCECSTTSTGSSGNTTTTVDPLATTTTLDPLATTTSEPTGSRTSTASMASSSPTSVDPSTSTPSTSIASDDPLPSSSTAAPQTTTTEEPTNPQYRFEFQAYHFQPYTTTNVVGRVRVLQADGKPLASDDIVTFFWDLNPPDEALNCTSNIFHAHFTENAPESSSESDGFTMDQTTGSISMKGATEAIYNPVAQAIVNGVTSLLVDVTITVLEPFKCDDTFFIAKSLITKTVLETDHDVLVAEITTQVDPADKYCITDVDPVDYAGLEYFSVNDQGQLTLGSSIDVDPDGDQVVTVRVEAQSATDVCPKISSGGDLFRNEVLVQVTIKDANDQEPSLVLPPSGNTPTRVGYPSNRGLQQVVGPVMTLKAKDNDTVGSLDFSISGDYADLFVVQTDTTTGSGALYLLNHEACGDMCDVTVTVTDGSHTADGQKIEVHSLDLSHIYDISQEDMSPDEIEDYVNKLSVDTDLDLHLLYCSLSVPSSARSVQIGPRSTRDESVMVFTKRFSRGLKIQELDLVDGGAKTWFNEDLRGRRIQRRDVGSTNLNGRNGVKEEKADGSSSWTSLAHIYGFQADGSIVTLDVLNSAMAKQPEAPQAIEFSEKATFELSVDEVSLSGWKAAVGVLGALVGLMLLAALLGFVWYRRRQMESPAAKSGPSLAVSTIGSAYPNHGYENIAMSKLDSTSTSSDDSVNKKASGKRAGDTNNNDKPNTGKITNVEIMANPFTSVTVPDSPIYEDPSDSISTPRNMLLHTSTSSPQTRTRDPSSTDSRDEVNVLQPQQGALRRITPGPLLERAKSSPYLAKSAGDFEAFRPSDNDKVASFTPYKGGEGSESPTLSSKPASNLLAYKPVFKPEAFSYLDDVPRREVKDTAEKKDKSDSPKKQTKLDTSPYAFPVRTKKEPPNLALATPAKPIMKSSRDSNLVSTSAEVHRSADDPASSSGGFTSLKGSPPLQQKGDGRERKSSLKYYTSEGETSDSELKKSVAFKVLVDEKHIKRRKEDKEKEDAKEKEKEKKEGNDKDEQEIEEETEDL